MPGTESQCLSASGSFGLLVAGSIGLAVLDLDLHAFLHLREVALGPSAGSPWSYVGLTSFVATLFVTGAAAVPPNAIFCNRIIRTAGVCGYSFYIWQVLVMQTIFGAEYYHDRSLYPRSSSVSRPWSPISYRFSPLPFLNFPQ